VIELVLSQLSDVFRIGLIMALVLTMRRTAPVTGRVLPLAAGVVFVAVLLPSTMPGDSHSLRPDHSGAGAGAGTLACPFSTLKAKPHPCADGVAMTPSKSGGWPEIRRKIPKDF